MAADSDYWSILTLIEVIDKTDIKTQTHSFNIVRFRGKIYSQMSGEQIDFSGQFQARASYRGVYPPETYFNLNSDLSILAERVSSGQLFMMQSLAFLNHANMDQLDQVVKIIPLPIPITRQISAGIVSEMSILRDRGYLKPLRGNRPTDLARPLAQEVRNVVLTDCPVLRQFILNMEDALLETIFLLELLNLMMLETQPQALLGIFLIHIFILITKAPY